MNYQIIKAITILFALLAAFGCKQTKQDSDITTEHPTSEALPQGMKLVWNDEFNGSQLDTTKWWDRYFSSLDWSNQDALQAMKDKNLPPADYEFTGSSIILRATNNLYPGANRQISSIQTYNWETNTNLMENAIGGFFETRIRRDIGQDGDKVNIAFWFDSPGPDLKYYLEEGGQAFDTQGIRPRGQLFEIDLCEYITTEIVLHGNVDPEGKFERNIGHYIHKGDFKGKWVTHSMLWLPAGLKFYIDGKLIAEWWDPNDIKSPNHAMNMFFGAYGINDVSMEVDYVRYYQWDTEDGNLLPNGSFEYSDNIFPWEGTGSISKDNPHTGKQALKLMPGEKIEQLIYLDPNTDYKLDLWAKGNSDIIIEATNIKAVVGTHEISTKLDTPLSSKYENRSINFSTLNEHEGNKRTVKISIINTGKEEVTLDSASISQLND